MLSIALFFFIALPWLNPFSVGPTPVVVSLLFSWTCAAALLGAVAVAKKRGAAGRLVSATAMAWLLAALLSSLLGLLQYFGATAVFGPWVSSSGAGEAFANLRQRNQFASLTNIGLAALLWWAAARPALAASPADAARAAPRRRPAVASVAAAILLGMGNAASSSRTGLVQLAMLLALAWVWGGWRRPALRRVLLAAVLAYAGAAWALPALASLAPQGTGILARLQDTSLGCGSRLTLWGNVLHLIAQKPWFGWGWGELDYAHFITLYPGARFCDILDNAHNLPLQLAVELGVPTALAVCGAGLWLAWRAQPWRETDATRQLAWSVLAVILLHSQLEYPLWYGPFQLALGLCLWLLWRSPVALAAAGTVPHPARCATAALFGKYERCRALAPHLYGVLAIGLIASFAYAAWDYHRISQLYRTPGLRAAAYRDHTLAKVRGSWLFQPQVRFAELTTTPLTPANAAQLRELALASLHFSPEPRVIEKLIDSAVLLGLADEAQFYRVRYQAAFPDSYASWAENNPR